MKKFLLAAVLVLFTSCASKVLVRQSSCETVADDIASCKQVK